MKTKFKFKDAETELATSYKDFGYYFEGDTDQRAIFNVTMKRATGSYTFTFGQSVANGRNEPTNYDILACLEVYCPDTFEGFCSEYGYDTDSRSALNVFEAVQEQAAELNDLFSSEELEKLSEIR